MTELDYAGCSLKLDCQDHHVGSDEWLLERYWTPKPGEVCVDIGCGPGTWVLVGLAKGAYVYGFDPKAAAIAMIERHLPHNNGFQPRCHLFCLGLLDYQGWARFGCNSYRSADGSVPMLVSTLDNVFEQVNPGRIHYVNLDVEGSELATLEGARRTLISNLPKLIVEIHDGVDWHEVEEKVKSFGPYTTQIVGGHLIGECS